MSERRIQIGDPAPDVVTQKLNVARAEIARILKTPHPDHGPGVQDARTLAQCDAALAIIAAIDALKAEVRGSR